MAAADEIIPLAYDEEEFEIRVREFATTCPDYEETVETMGDCMVSLHVAKFIKTAKGGVQVAYHLAKNQQLLSKIQDLDPDNAVLA